MRGLILAFMASSLGAFGRGEARAHARSTLATKLSKTTTKTV
jgi:hypothetical protein